MNKDLYAEIVKVYESTDEIESTVAFEFGLKNDLYYQLFYSYTDDNYET